MERRGWGKRMREERPLRCKSGLVVFGAFLAFSLRLRAGSLMIRRSLMMVKWLSLSLSLTVVVVVVISFFLTRNCMRRLLRRRSLSKPTFFFLVEMPFSRENQTAKSKLERFEDSMKLYFMFRWRTESDEIKVSLLFRRKMKINIVFNNFKNT